MTTAEMGIQLPNLQLENRRKSAVSLLDAYISRDTSPLRSDQMDAMHSLREFFAGDKSAGYMSLPTGYGKTAIFTQLTEALGMRTIVLSPTRKILSRTRESFGEFSPDVEVGNYFSEDKNTTGQVINTTYQSLPNLIEGGEINPDEIDLIICDEVHTALGEQRYSLFRNFPNALKIGLTATPYFNQLDGYKERGIVKDNEQWTGIFENLIHEMSLEEAMERGFLAKLDINLLKTGVDVGSVQIDSKGNYNEQDIKRYLDKQVRNDLTLAILKGIESLPAGVSFDPEQMEQITQLHQRADGKKTAIFGFSVEHIKNLAELLRKNGISAQAVYGSLPFKKQAEIFDSYESGDTQVILGVDLLNLGWDSPKTAVGIFLAPTQSGIVAVQQLGRILRTDPSKEEAIAIQMVDEYRLLHQSPILIPDIFDPYYVLRGTQQGKEKSTDKYDVKQKSDSPITISGYRVDTLVNRAKSVEILRSRFKKSSIEEINTAVDSILAEVYKEDVPLSTHEFLKKINTAIPFRIPQEAAELALQAIASIDSNKAALGKKAIVFLYAGTILSGIDRFLSKDADENDEICQAAVERVLSGLLTKNQKRVASGSIYAAAERGAAEYIAQKRNMPPTWILDDKNHSIINSALLDFSINRPQSNREWEERISHLRNLTGISSKNLMEYFKYAFGKGDNTDEIDDSTEANGFTFASQLNRQDVITDILTTLTPRERFVLKERFGLNEDTPKTLEQVAIMLNVTKERIRQIEAKALRKMRHPTRSRKLINILSGDTQIWQREVPDQSYQTKRTILPKSEDAENLTGVAAQLAVNLSKLPLLKPGSITTSSRWSNWAKQHPLPENYTGLDEQIRYAKYAKEMGISHSS